MNNNATYVNWTFGDGSCCKPDVTGYIQCLS